jgi:chromosome segregation ATPase
MKSFSAPFLVLLLMGMLFSDSVPADEALEFLKTEIQRTARQRDEARKQLLETQSDAEMRVNALSEAQESLNRQLEENSRELLNLEAAARMSRSSVERAEEEIEARDARIQSLEQQQVQNRSQLQGLQQQLQDMQATEAGHLDLQQDYQDLQNTLQDRDAELEALRVQRNQSAAEQAELSELNNQLQQELRNTRRAESLATAKQAALETRLSHLQSELAQQYEMRSELEQEQERLQAVIADLQNRLDLAESTRVPQAELEEVQATLDAALSENQKLREDLLSRQEIPDLRGEFTQMRRERDLLQATQKTLMTRLEEMQQTLEQEQQNAEERSSDFARRELDREQQLAALQTMLEDQQTQYAAAERQIEILEGGNSNLEEVKGQRDNLIQMRDRSRQDMKTLATHIYTLREQLVDSRQKQIQMNRAAQQQGLLSQALYESKKDLDSLNRLNNALLREGREKETRIRQLRLDLESGHDRARRIESEKQALQRQLQEIRALLEVQTIAE